MGLYNEIVFECPSCKETIFAQTKSGSSSLKTISSNHVPEEEISGLDKIIYCESCNNGFTLHKKPITYSKLYLIPNNDD